MASVDKLRKNYEFRYVYNKGKVYSNIIPRNVKLAEAPSYGMPIMLYDKSCKGAEAYMELAQEFLEYDSDGGEY
jgi:chromosome partitioning protein